jgi:hypothetical protein
MSTTACYGLRNHPDGAPFAEAWDNALDRVREGTEVFRWWKG